MAGAVLVEAVLGEGGVVQHRLELAAHVQLGLMVVQLFCRAGAIVGDGLEVQQLFFMASIGDGLEVQLVVRSQ